MAEVLIVESKYISIHLVAQKPKTSVYEIRTKKLFNEVPVVLGRIWWYGQWRQYAFFPETDTVWNKDCLDTIQTFLQRLMEERKK